MATRQEEARQAREAKLDELHEKLTGAVERLVTGEDWADALRFAARFRSRSFNNVCLIWTAHMEAFEQGRVPDPFPTLVAGYKQWQQLGRQVEKGQAGYQILAPVTGKFASANPSDPGSWYRLERGEKPKPGEVVRSKMVGARPAYVWDVSQTEGPDSIPERPAPKLLTGQAPQGLREGLVERIEAEGFELRWVPHEGLLDGANGRTSFTDRWVAVRENMDDAAQVKTLAHELAHALMHGPDQEAVQHRGIGEVEAESVALMVGAAHGMDTTGYTIPYVAGWAANVDGKEPVEVVKATGERVRKTAAGILDQLDTDQVPDGTPPGLTRDGPTQKAAAQEAAARRVEPLPGPDREAPAPAGRGL